MSAMALNTHPGRPGRLVDWWLRELEAALPSRLPGLPRRRRDAHVLLWDDRAPVLIRRGRPGHTHLPLEAFAAERAAAITPFVLRFPHAAGLQQRVLLPRAAEHDLERVLEFEMDRLTPFTAERVLYGFRRLGIADAGRKIEIELAVLPSTSARAALDRLQGLGLAPRRIELAGPTATAAPLELRGRREVGHRRGGRRGIALALGLYAIATALILAWLGWAYLERRAEITGLAARIATAQASNTELGALRRELAGLAAVNQRIEQERRQRPSAAVLLEVLSRLLPDEVWLTELELDRRTVRIGGFADDPAALIPLLAGSPHLSEIGFAAPSVRDPESGRVRFTIAGEVRPLRSLGPP